LPERIVLIGLRGSGKSLVAAELGRILGWPWTDLDAEVEKQSGQTIAQLFAHGEAYFRECETRTLSHIWPGRYRILAAGGGTVVRQENRARLRQGAQVVWLAAQPATCAARLAADSLTAVRRPALTSLGTHRELATLALTRFPMYWQCADWVVDTTYRTPAEVAATIVRWLALDSVGTAQERDRL